MLQAWHKEPDPRDIGWYNIADLLEHHPLESCDFRGSCCSMCTRVV